MLLPSIVNVSSNNNDNKMEQNQEGERGEEHQHRRRRRRRRHSEKRSRRRSSSLGGEQTEDQGPTTSASDAGVGSGGVGLSLNKDGDAPPPLRRRQKSRDVVTFKTVEEEEEEEEEGEGGEGGEGADKSKRGMKKATLTPRSSPVITRAGVEGGGTGAGRELSEFAAAVKTRLEAEEEDQAQMLSAERKEGDRVEASATDSAGGRGGGVEVSQPQGGGTGDTAGSRGTAPVAVPGEELGQSHI